MVALDNVLDNAIWFFLICTLIIGMIDDIEHKQSNVLPKIVIYAFIIYLVKQNSSNFFMHFWLLATLYPIVEFFLITKGYDAPMFDHLLPSFIALILILAKYYAI